jgi:hypothetical protein
MQLSRCRKILVSHTAAVQASALQPYLSSAGEVSSGQNGRLFGDDGNVSGGLEHGGQDGELDYGGKYQDGGDFG